MTTPGQLTAIDMVDIVPILPPDASGGGLLATQASDGTCTLWFCTLSAREPLQHATWRQVVLADPAPPPGPPGQLEFIDWISASPQGANGILHGQPVTLTGPMGTGSDFNATFQQFNTPAFTPQLAASDCVEIVGQPGHSFTLNFGAPVRDPVLLLASFGSVITFAPGTTVVRLSGEDTFIVSGNTVTGQVSAGDSAGTVQLPGVFTTIAFTAVTNFPPAPTVPDGIFLQAGGTPV
ncbi:MAG TPA: hypothetical protein VH637_16540 [Streptosporangiaceae bacterium]|jgi:hypothetical protein